MNELLGELKEFKRVALEEMAALKSDVRALNEWKWRVTAYATCASTIASTVITVSIHWLFGGNK